MNKLKKIKLFLLAIIAIFTIVACDKDLYEEAINQDKEINIKQISLEKFNSKMRQMKNKPEIERFMVSSRNGSALSRTESTSEFEIITDDIKEITQGDYTSYTMYLKTPDTTNNIYNITIEEIDGNSSFFITKYIPKTYWLENKNLPFDGEIITYRESNTNSSGANTLQEYLDLIYGELYAGGAGGGGSLSLTGTSGGTSWSSGLGGSPIYPQNCNGTVKTDYILEPKKCSLNRHWPWQTCSLDDGAQPYYELTPYYTCVPNTPSGGNTSGSGDTSGGNTLGGGGSGSGTGTGSGGTNTGAVTGSITTIVDPTEECNAPRGDLNNDCMLDENEANFVTFLDNLTPEERRLVNGDNNLKMNFFNYLKGQSWSNESKLFAQELIDLANDHLNSYGNTLVNQNFISEIIIEILNPESDDVEPEDVDIDPNCESFNFQQTGSNWQESAVLNIHFQVTVISPQGIYVNHLCEFPQAILFGCPINLSVGNTNLSPGLAAATSAQALEQAMDETVKKFGNKPVSGMIVDIYFKKRLKHNYPLYIPGGRVNFNSNNFTVTPTQYRTSFFGNGNCN